MSEFKKQFSSLTPEYLLKLRARGDELSEEAHRAIEEVFAERGEYLPVKPKKAIAMTGSGAQEGKTGRLFKSVALIVLAAFVMGIAKAMSHTWLGVLVTVGLVIYGVANWLRRRNLSPSEREREDNEKMVEKEGLTEIMICAAEGNLDRLRELVEYGSDVNATTLSGATALMYAARNNKLSAVEYLLTMGADPKRISDNESTAMDIARKYGYLEVSACLARHIAQTDGQPGA